MLNVSHNKNKQRRKTRLLQHCFKYFICDLSKHKIRKCFYFKKFKTYIKKRNVKNERIKKKKTQTLYTYRRQRKIFEYINI